MRISSMLDPYPPMFDSLLRIGERTGRNRPHLTADYGSWRSPPRKHFYFTASAAGRLLVVTQSRNARQAALVWSGVNPQCV